MTAPITSAHRSVLHAVHENPGDPHGAASRAAGVEAGPGASDILRALVAGGLVDVGDSMITGLTAQGFQECSCRLGR